MSPSVFSCILCGFPIYESEEPTTGSWLSQFRASELAASPRFFATMLKEVKSIVYSDPNGSFVSGVGCRDDNEETTWAAPADPILRWDDERSPDAFIDLPVMQQPPLDGQHGFVIHEACWQLLQKPFFPGDIPLKRLLDICESLPFPLQGLGVYWGHNYGNLLVFEDKNLYSWEDLLVEDCYHTASRLCAMEDPYNVHDIPVSQSTRMEYPLTWSPSTQSKDCFSKLPWEILEFIAITLPTRYALDLRHVSTAFLPILYSQTFWASRFEADGDRGFMFEKWETRDATDWLDLYRLTSLARCSPGLKNRSRIWDLIKPLVKTINLRLAEDLNRTCEGRLDSSGWTKVEGDLQEMASNGYPRSFDQGCRLFDTHVAHISTDISKIAFSFSSVGNVNYISGIRILANKGPDVCLGYISRTNEDILEVTTLRGMVLAMGSRGLHALQVIQEDASLSPWVGSPSNVPITERLASFNRIENLKIGFDGFKIISLGVSSFAPVLEVQSPSLRELALWYPNVPGLGLCLNEHSFTGEIPSKTRYQPLFWIHFGGPSGRSLKNVNSVSFDTAKGLYGLEFHYDTNHAPVERDMYKLGRRKHSSSLKKEEFRIDGAGGEVIESIEVTLQRYTQANLYSFLKHGILNAVKITTNRKRSFQAGRSSGDATLVPLMITPGTTITGLYASQHPEFGIISIGAISEFVIREGE